MHTVILALIGVSGGIIVGNAAGAFISLLQIVQRLSQVTDTGEKIPFYKWILIVSATLFSFIFFSNFSFKLNKYIPILVGLSFGIFVGLIASALAEVLNVIPVLAKKLEMTKYIPYLLISIAIGKVSGSLLYWLVLVNYK